MGSSHGRRKRRLLFGPSKGEQLLAVWYSPRGGDYERIWICPEYVPSKELSLRKLAIERAERSLLPRRRKSRRGQRAGKCRSRGGKPRSPLPVRPSTANQSRSFRRDRRFDDWVEKRSQYFVDRILAAPQRFSDHPAVLRGLAHQRKCFKGFSSQIRRAGFSPMSYKSFRALCRQDTPWLGCPDIRVRMSRVGGLSDLLSGSNISLTYSTSVPPPMVLTGGFLFRNNTRRRPPCRSCGYHHERNEPHFKSTPRPPRRGRGGKSRD